MTTEKIGIDTLHFEHRLWSNELKFAQDELTIYEHRLEEMVRKYTNIEMLKGLEKFQNKFITQKKVLHDLLSRIDRHEHRISEFAKAHAEDGQELSFTDHNQIRSEMEDFKRLYGELKIGFYKFVTTWM